MAQPDNSPRIIGLCARAGHGKSTVAKMLVECWGARIEPLAKALKTMAQKIYGLTDAQVYGTQEDKDRVDPRWGKSPRVLLQELGTEIVRETLGEDVWVNATLASIRRQAALDESSRIYVIDDVRFPNEVKEINRAGGKIIRLVCPDAPPPENPNHPSETGPDQIDPNDLVATVVSNRSPGSWDLLNKVRDVLNLPQMIGFRETLNANARRVKLETLAREVSVHG